jgi:hypothetical protein
VDERPAPVLADDLGAEDDVAERARLTRRQRLEPVDRERENVRRLVDAQVLALERLHLAGTHEGDPQLARGDPLPCEHLAREGDGARLVDDGGAPVRDLHVDHQR